MFEYENRFAVLPVLVEMTENLSTETPTAFLKPLQGV